jgi:branched-chain amino acid transport system substrate-binding protein
MKAGLVVTQTGPDTSGAEPAIQGAAVALADIEAQHRAGAGRDLQLVTKDDGGDPAIAGRLCAQLAREGVVAIVGSESPSSRAACSKAAGAAHIAYLAADGSDGTECYANAFFFGLVPNQRAVPMVGFLMAKLSAKQLYIVGADDPAGRVLAIATANAISAAGGAVAGSVLVPPDATQFGTILAAIAAARPAAVLDGLTGSQAIAYHKQFAADLRTRAITRASLQMQEAEASTIGPGAAPLYLASDYLAADPSTANQDWLAALTAKFGDNAVATASAAEASDAIELLAAAIAKANSTRAADVTAAFPGVSYSGPRGTVDLKPANHGYATLATHVGQLNKIHGTDQVEATAPLDPAVRCA